MLAQRQGHRRAPPHHHPLEKQVVGDLHKATVIRRQRREEQVEIGDAPAHRVRQQLDFIAHLKRAHRQQEKRTEHIAERAPDCEKTDCDQRQHAAHQREEIDPEKMIRAGADRDHQHQKASRDHQRPQRKAWRLQTHRKPLDYTADDHRRADRKRHDQANKNQVLQMGDEFGGDCGNGQVHGHGLSQGSRVRPDIRGGCACLAHEQDDRETRQPRTPCRAENAISAPIKKPASRSETGSEKFTGSFRDSTTFSSSVAAAGVAAGASWCARFSRARSQTRASHGAAPGAGRHAYHTPSLGG